MLSRLRAWWDGADSSAAPAHRRSRLREEMAQDHAPPPAAAEGGWPPARIKLVQAVWGRGFVGPNSAERAVELVRGCGLSKADTVLDIGPGAGGGPLAVTNRFRNYVVAHVGDRALAAKGLRLAQSYGVQDRLQFDGGDFGAIKVKSGIYRAVLVRDVLHRVADKPALLGQAAGGLRENEGEMIVTGLMAAGDLAASPAVEWVRAEHGTAHPWTLDELKAGLAALSLIVRTEDDETDWYRHHVQETWRSYQADLTGQELAAEQREILLAEARRWALRMAAVEAGQLAYWRLLVVPRR